MNETKLIHSRQSDANPLVVCRLTPPNYSPFLAPQSAQSAKMLKSHFLAVCKVMTQILLSHETHATKWTIFAVTFWNFPFRHIPVINHLSKRSLKSSLSHLLFSILLVNCLCISWVAKEWSPGSSDRNATGQTGDMVELYAFCYGPMALWRLWSCSTRSTSWTSSRPSTYGPFKCARLLWLLIVPVWAVVYALYGGQSWRQTQM